MEKVCGILSMFGSSSIVEEIFENVILKVCDNPKKSIWSTTSKVGEIKIHFEEQKVPSV
jgi:hypothetical protein